MGTKNPKEQCFMHIATYHLADLRTVGDKFGPDILDAEITPAVVDTISTRLSDVCVQHGWDLIDISVLPDRIEALLMGTEPDGETGEAVAAVLDGAMYGRSGLSAAGAMS